MMVVNSRVMVGMLPAGLEAGVAQSSDDLVILDFGLFELPVI